MVPGEGAISNPEDELLSLYQALEGKDTFIDNLEIDELFNTLSEWNDYLENHVPSFQEMEP